ncbi:MAG: NAD(+)/NADH kinase [bacterium]|nr:NAD(+)/NADH kinase [bacterium]
MTSQIPKTFHIFYYPSNKKAISWAVQINTFVKKKFPDLRNNSKNPEVVIVLGGDGTILEAARKYHELGSVILGLNLGNVGFLASVREEKDFLKSLADFLDGKFGVVERMMLSAQVQRRGKTVFAAEALNEIVVKNPLGMVELQAKIAGHPVKEIKGTGILVSTATGSTAYNLSAHGPIVMPDIKCLVVTELLDHSIPSPSLVVKYSNNINIEVVSFRERGLISLSKTGKKIDVLLVADGESVFPLQEKDEVIIKSSPHLIKFAELEKNYFFKSLQEKFGFK